MPDLELYSMDIYITDSIVVLQEHIAFLIYHNKEGDLQSVTELVDCQSSSKQFTRTSPRRPTATARHDHDSEAR